MHCSYLDYLEHIIKTGVQLTARKEEMHKNLFKIVASTEVV